MSELEDEARQKRAETARAVFRHHRAKSTGGGQYRSAKGRFAKSGGTPLRDNNSKVLVGEDADQAPHGSGGLDEKKNWVAPPGTYRSKTGTGPSGWDPHAVGEVIAGISRRQGWEHTLSVAQVSADWEEIVGPQVALHCPIDSFEGGVLIAQADSTAWAQQLQLLLPHIHRRIDERVGPGIVEKVLVRAPRAPSWVHGNRSVKGRGPRDTYG